MNQLNHVAIIMDGNGRWGLKKKKTRNYGHLKGIKSVENVIKSSLLRKIPYLTLYTFSTDNWGRPYKEINFLFDLIRKSLKKKINKIIKQGIKINIIGSEKGLPKDIVKIVRLIEKKTYKNKKITLNLALNYGSKEEIINAVNKYSKKNKKKITLNGLENELYTRNIPDPEILIRTGGTRRLSNFLLWQLAYTEIFFLDKLWPDFNENDFNKIIVKFNKLKRNFGKINE
jgi:undecaprenyl diphosphate synthase